jgi:vacuolar-type H+-ATPase subunit H
MVEESLRAIFGAEKKAKELTEAAKCEAVTILESARREAGKLKDSAKLGVTAKTQKVLEDSKKNAGADAQELLNGARRRILTMERKAKERHVEAVKLVVDAVAG